MPNSGCTVPHLPDGIPIDLNEQQRRAARRAVAVLTRRAVDKGDVDGALSGQVAAEVMLTLGIYPDQHLPGFLIPETLQCDWCM